MGWTIWGYRMVEAAASDCAADPVGHTRHLFVEVAQASAIATGERPARRAVFRKAHGVVHGRLELDPGRPAAIRRGIFEREAYEVWARFSSDVAPTEPDGSNGTLGMALKLFGVVGGTLADVDPTAPTADIVLQNHDVFFVDTGLDMCVFTDLALKGRVQEWFARHPKTETILTAMRKREESVFTATYWSVLPYACGDQQAVKYRVRPLQHVIAGSLAESPDRLRRDLVQRLANGDMSFSFEVQLPIGGAMPPIDQATYRWSEAEAPFVEIGRLHFERQDATVEGQEGYGETLTFNPWRVPEANRPLGSIAQSRRASYPASAAQRHRVNGDPDAEPHAPRRP